jgi:hypothetical protein
MPTALWCEQLGELVGQLWAARSEYPTYLEVPAWYRYLDAVRGSVTQTSCMPAGCMLARLVLGRECHRPPGAAQR